MEGGDLENKKGEGGESIYGESFTEEDSDIKFIEPGLLCMIRNEENKSDSKFFVTKKSLKNYDLKYFPIGKLINDSLSVLKRIMKTPCDENGFPTLPIKIDNCDHI